MKLTQHIKNDLIAAICVIFYIGLVYYVSYVPFEKCKTYDPKIAEHNIQYRSYYQNILKCDSAAERELLNTKPLSVRGLFWRLTSTIAEIQKEEKIPYQDWFVGVYQGLMLCLMWGLNAVLVAVHIDCYFLAFTIFFTFLVHWVFYFLKWKITWVTWLITYGVLVSKLYGETFDIMVVFLSYGAAVIFIIGLAIGMIMSFFGKQ